VIVFQIFSGNFSFHHIRNEFQLIRVVKQGGRPPRPTHNLCHSRGLTDAMWNLMEDCWADHPQNRPSAAEVVPRIRTLCDTQVDDRPWDTFPLLLSPQLLRSKSEHPLAALWDMAITFNDGMPPTHTPSTHSRQAESPASNDHDHGATTLKRDPEQGLGQRGPKRRKTQRTKKGRPGTCLVPCRGLVADFLFCGT
jgi:hypothetical protein